MISRRGFVGHHDGLVVVAIIALLIGIFMPILGFLWTLLVILSIFLILSGIGWLADQRRMRAYNKRAEMEDNKHGR